MTLFASLFEGSSRKTFLVFFILSSVLPLLIMVFLVYQYLIPLLNPEQIHGLINVFTFGFAGVLFICILSFFLMSRYISSLEDFAKEIEEKSTETLETSIDSVNENEIDTLRSAFNSLSSELVEKVTLLKKYSEEVIDQNRKFSLLATIDALTSLYNRRKFEQTLSEELSRAERYNHLLSLILIDVNGFKLYNDTYGHQTGDMILKTMSKLFRESIRQTDIPFRYGGDEFAILLPEASKEQAEDVCKKLINVVSNYQFVETGRRSIGKVTISCGVSSHCKGVDMKSFFTKADFSLYENKNARKHATTSTAA